MIGTLTVEHLNHAVAHEERTSSRACPAWVNWQKLIFELKDKLAIDHATGLTAISDIDTDVLATLTALGYSVVEAQRAAGHPRDAPQDIEERVRLALQYFT